MKFIVNKNDIISVLSNIQGLTGRKSSLAITSNVLIEAFDNKIKFSATDLETGYRGVFPANVEKEGIIAINARKFYEIVNNFPTDQIEINEEEEQWIRIGNESVEYYIVGMNHVDFPEIEIPDEIDFFEIESQTLKEMIEKTIVISHTGDEKRAHITGINFDKHIADDNKFLRLASTDVKRLNLVTYEFKNQPANYNEEQLILPKKGMSEVNKFLDNEGLIKTGFFKNHFFVKKDNESIVIRILEGKFPKYDTLNNIDEEFNIKIDKIKFSMLLKRMSILTSDKYKSVVFSFSENKLTITATNPEIGESKEEFEIEYNREEIEAAFNPRYFLETVNMIGSEKVVINIENNQKPCKVFGEDNMDFLSIIMPMKM
ncbi:MAG: DNA polymerase III subunit beta [Desulfobacterales bacterium]|nr:DNA polymerase III subunit beta [Desulfobacterales bacterium]MCP4160983.1 DNA polymerase III subunit beta [Deltaproteobacteria bacterium]